MSAGGKGVHIDMVSCSVYFHNNKYLYHVFSTLTTKPCHYTYHNNTNLVESGEIALTLSYLLTPFAAKMSSKLKKDIYI